MDHGRDTDLWESVRLLSQTGRRFKIVPSSALLIQSSGIFLVHQQDPYLLHIIPGAWLIKVANML